MLALEDLPPLSNTAFAALIGLLLVFWLAMRVNIVRRRGAHLDPGQSPRGPAWLLKLAAWPGTYPALAILAAGFVALLVM